VRKFMLLIVALIPSLTGVALADALNYTLIGNGGTSGPVAGVSANSFMWAGTAEQGTVSGSILTQYGFDPLSGSFRGNTPDPFSSNNNFSGSLLLSSAFTVDGTQQLTVNFGEMSAQKFANGNFEFAALVQNNQVSAILGLVSPVSTLTGTESPNFLGTFFEPLTAGVQLNVNYEHQGYPQPFQLGANVYNCSGLGDSNVPCQSDFTSTYHPAAGTYQLMFGAFGKNSLSNGVSAVAVKSVQVPEEGIWTDLFISLLALSLVYWRWNSGRMAGSFGRAKA